VTKLRTDTAIDMAAAFPSAWRITEYHVYELTNAYFALVDVSQQLDDGRILWTTRPDDLPPVASCIPVTLTLMVPEFDNYVMHMPRNVFHSEDRSIWYRRYVAAAEFFSSWPTRASSDMPSWMTIPADNMDFSVAMPPNAPTSSGVADATATLHSDSLPAKPKWANVIAAHLYFQFVQYYANIHAKYEQ
jgi:hypothetical protein